MEAQSTRRQQAQQELGLETESANRQAEHALNKENARREEKLRQKQRIQNSTSYQLIGGIAKVMDKYCLDPILGLIPGVGDFIASVCTLPFLYVSLFKVRSIPLTLAVIRNMMVDLLLGSIPFWIGDIIDFFYRANLKNHRLITGFVEDDREIIAEVNRKAFWTAIWIGIIGYAIYWTISLLAELLGKIFH